MLRGACQSVRSSRTCQSARRLHSQTSSSSANRALIAVSGSVATAAALWYSIHSTQGVIFNDAPVSEKLQSSRPQLPETSLNSPDSLNSIVWGSNKNHVLSMENSTADSVHTPAAVAWLDNVALRDLALHERHAACVDARGDVYQWGDGFGQKSSLSSGRPTLTLRGKNIVHLQVTPSRVFALSASGRVYTLSSSAAMQDLPAGTPTPASTPWWGTGWLWGEEEEVDFAEVVPNEKLAWGEKFVSIAAGSDHLLALTSTGRTFAHPISLKANTYGQLGFRKFDVPAPSHHPHLHVSHTRLPIELTPKSISDPYAKATPAIRRTASALSEDTGSVKAVDLTNLDDSTIRFSDKLFEVPALRGVHVDRIAAGGRTSFVKTSTGRVLGWGANEYGQIGLGSTVTLDTITVPTEVILWRSTPATMRTTCLDVYAGGDLTFFKVERSDGTAMPYIDVLACGNGQWGGLGNSLYSNAQSTPVRARNVSGLLEYSEASRNLQPIMPEDISVSPTGHVLLTLDTRSHAGPGGGGRDIMAWGANSEYQLGNGKRGTVALPTTVLTPGGERFMLGKRKSVEVRDLQNKVWKRGVDVEQYAVAGWGNSLVYWKICSTGR
ncbi:regulator of chromosome condensation 1/beta-lactamase-inhibitor protein II [Sparassis latifolia]|uniref:RCC1/BLIP-II n=1 Tax=Sparassis crispa TaxID=139825 RepID=A0A401GJQ1_9APHY|nr:RCC1/BLIP-II [Sparassis crispa]GBE82398.1 RCC1/BLIP-II [Sparassis crispa]